MNEKNSSRINHFYERDKKWIWCNFNIISYSECRLIKNWLKKNEVSIATTWTNMRDEHAAFFNQLNKKIDEIKKLTKNYNIQANKLHDIIFIIRELRMKQRERNVEAKNSNTLLFIIQDEIIVFTFKKLSDSFVFTDDKDFIIDD